MGSEVQRVLVPTKIILGTGKNDYNKVPFLNHSESILVWSSQWNHSNDHMLSVTESSDTFEYNIRFDSFTMAYHETRVAFYTMFLHEFHGFGVPHDIICHRKKNQFEIWPRNEPNYYNIPLSSWWFFVEERLSTKGIEAKQGFSFFWCGAAVFDTISFFHEFVSPHHHPCFNFGISNLFPNRFIFLISFTNNQNFFATFTDTFSTKHSVPKDKDPGSSPDCLVGDTLFVLRKISAGFFCTVQLLWMCLQGRNVNFFPAITFCYMSTMPQRPFFIFAHGRMLSKCWLRRLVSETLTRDWTAKHTLSEQKELPQQITLKAWSAGLKSSENDPAGNCAWFLDEEKIAWSYSIMLQKSKHKKVHNCRATWA